MARHIPGPLFAVQHGSVGVPMIFLHSTPDDHRLWMHQTAHFSAWYRTVAVDLAGYGRSPAVQPGVMMADHAAACWEVLDRVAPGGAIIQGNSMGSFVAMHMAVQRPGQTKAMILSGCGYLPERPMMVRWKERYEKEGLGLRHFQVLDHFSDEAKKQPLVQHYAKMVVALNNEGTLASIIANNHALSHPVENDAFLAGIAVPTLVISGSADRNHASSFELAKRIKGCEVKTVEGAGHSSNFEKPWEFDRYCIEFLSSLGL
jgi:3-oxoadipate enol-lactonase